MSLSEDVSPAALSITTDRCMPATSLLDAAPASQRLASIDALRGFLMFWLIGGSEFALALVACLYPPWFDAVETQVTHPIWNGFVAWDLVMPLFLFVVGASMPLAMAKRREENLSRASTYGRIARRVALLWILGTITQAIRPEYEGFEFYSNALQAIAVGYLVTAMALLHLRLRGQIGLLAFLVLGYAALLMFVPFPGHPAGTLERRINLPHYIDELLLGGFRRDHSFAWVVPSLGFAATVLLGAMAGHLLRAPLSAKRRIVWLAAIGSGCMAAGWFWSYWLPWNRHLWTSSMTLWAGGISFWLTALFYAVIDVGGMRRWAFPLVVIGTNALLAYVVDPVFVLMSKALASAVLADVPTHHLELLSSFIEITAMWCILWYLYQKRIVLRA